MCLYMFKQVQPKKFFPIFSPYKNLYIYIDVYTRSPAPRKKEKKTYR